MVKQPEYAYLEENDGKARWHILVTCAMCNTKFYKPVRFAAQTLAHFCNKDCHNKKQRKNKIKVKCDTCGAQFEIQLKRYKRSKSKKFFCCKKHKTI